MSRRRRRNRKEKPPEVNRWGVPVDIAFRFGTSWDRVRYWGEDRIVAASAKDAAYIRDGRKQAVSS